MTTYADLGALIREARLEKGMSLGQLASAVGRSSSSVRRWERGEVAPAASVLPKLVAILDIDPQGLRHDGDTPTPVPEPEDDTAASDSEGVRVSTVEQPVVESDDAPASLTEPVPPPASTSDGGIFIEAWNVIVRSGHGWKAWIRGVVTLAVLIVMLLVLLWAVGELIDALGQVLDSFDVGSNGEEN
jgi:transcriptional regulator with XRE-family HTH domain